MTSGDKPQARYFSVSSVDEYLECPQRYYLRRVRRVEEHREQAPIRWRLGTVVHAGLQRAYEEARRGPWPGPDASMLTHLAAAQDGLRESAAEEGVTGGDLDWCLEVLADALEVLAVPRPQEVLLVEEQVVDTSDDGVILHGYMDLVLLLDHGGWQEARIRDWKVTSKTLPAETVARSPQLLLYAHLIRRKYPEVTRVWIEEYYPPACVGVSVESDRRMELEIVERCEMVAEMVEESSSTGEWTAHVGERCEECPVRSACPSWAEGSPLVAARAEIEGL